MGKNKNKKKRGGSAAGEADPPNINRSTSEKAEVSDMIALAKQNENRGEGECEDGDRDGEVLTKAQRKNRQKKRKLKEAIEIKKKAKLEGGGGGAASDKENHAKSEKEKAADSNADSDTIETEKEKEEVLYPYEVDDDDHCESPLVAYEHIAPVLDHIAASLHPPKTRETLLVYDPYFCEGSMVERLSSIGFKNVYNKKEDFYARISEAQDNRDNERKQLPFHLDYDVLVTNPPYSEPHVPRLLQFCAFSKKPFFLLMPNHFYMKDYYTPSLGSTVINHTFYISPNRRYQYTTPKGRRQAKSGKYTSPFPSFWYSHLGEGRERERHSLKAMAPETYGSGTELGGEKNEKEKDQALICLSLLQLPMGVLPDRDPRKKKERDMKKRGMNKNKNKNKNQNR